MKKQTLFIAVIFGMLMLSTFLVFSLQTPIANSTNSNSGVHYNSLVCTWVQRADGTIQDNGCSHNTLTTAGQNAIRDAVASGSTAAFNYIGLCNASFGGNCNATNSGDGSLYNEYPNDATGLNRSNAATKLYLGTGNWSYSRTFVANAAGMVTNKTGIFNATTGTTMLAVNTFTTSTLQTSDQITVNWSIWVA
jgi:hypothetical protein